MKAEFRVVPFSEGLSISRRGQQFSVFNCCFHNTINLLTIQINNETSFGNTTTKGLL